MYIPSFVGNDNSVKAQYIGAWLGSALVLLTYRDALNHYYDTDNSGKGTSDYSV